MFFQNTLNETMEMTTPVLTRKTQSKGVAMDMTTPVITKKVGQYLHYNLHVYRI